MTLFISTTTALFVGLLFGFLLGKKSQQKKDSYTKLQQQLNNLEQCIQRDSEINLQAHNFNVMCHRQSLIALRSYMLAIKHNAVKKQHYEEAQQCINVINNMEALINYPNQE